MSEIKKKNTAFPIAWFLFTVVVALCFVRLGFWQLDRAAQKQVLLDQFNASKLEKPIDINASLPLPTSKVMYRDSTATGSYISNQILLNNKIRNHVNGLEVLTPLKIENTNKVVLVNRGWVPHNGDYKKLPNVSVNNDLRSIFGYITHAPGIALKMGEADINTGWPRLMQYIEWDRINELYPDYEVQPFIIRLNESEPDGYERTWQVVAFTPEKNRGYAVQWFAFAVAVMTIFFILIWRSRKHD